MWKSTWISSKKYTRSTTIQLSSPKLHQAAFTRTFEIKSLNRPQWNRMWSCLLELARTLRPGQYFSIFKMPDGRTTRGSPSREKISYPGPGFRVFCEDISEHIYRLSSKYCIYDSENFNSQVLYNLHSQTYVFFLLRPFLNSNEMVRWVLSEILLKFFCSYVKGDFSWAVNC